MFFSYNTIIILPSKAKKNTSNEGIFHLFLEREKNIHAWMGFPILFFLK
jgi:hypothetical protein